VLTNIPPRAPTHFVHDRRGNVITEADGSGGSGTVGEYTGSDRPAAGGGGRGEHQSGALLHHVIGGMSWGTGAIRLCDRLAATWHPQDQSRATSSP